MWWIYLSCFIILIILAIISQSIKQKYIESFKQNDESIAKSLNICGRNIVFPYFRINGTLASSRANKTNLSYLNSGTCISTTRDPNINPSFAIVHENSLFYQLTTACLNINVDDYLYGSDPTTFSITFNNMNNNLLNLLTLNPLYVEFNLPSNNITIGYSITGPITYNTNLTNYTLTFTPVFNPQVMQDDLFNYPMNMPSKVPILNSDLQSIKAAGLLNITAYYLDTLDTSFQSVGRTLNIKYNNQGSNNIFQQNYANLYGVSSSIQAYEFMNMLSLMYANQIAPVLSFQFQIQVQTPPLNSIQNIIMKTTAGNYVGAYTSCTNAIDIPATPQLNNIFSASIIDNGNNTYTLSVFTAKNQDCGLNNSSIVSCILPYSQNNMTVILTLSPTNKILFVCWRDIFNNNQINSTYTNIKLCSENDGLYDLFINPIAKDTLNDINMNYVNNYITNVNNCTLGYVNYNTVLNSI